MFTGIIENVGTISDLITRAEDRRLWVRAPFDLSEVALGDSIAINGCCLTVTEKRGAGAAQEFSADVSPETLEKTALGSLQVGEGVNLELALKVGDRLGGHWVQGHVDGVGELTGRQEVKSGAESYHLLQVKVPTALAGQMIPKGSVCVDGISLTINKVEGAVIELCVIPHTLSRTTLTQKNLGANLNIEADYLVKIIEQRLEHFVRPLLKEKLKK